MRKSQEFRERDATLSINVLHEKGLGRGWLRSSIMIFKTFNILQAHFIFGNLEGDNIIWSNFYFLHSCILDSNKCILGDWMFIVWFCLDQFSFSNIAIGVCISYKITDKAKLATFLSAWPRNTEGAGEITIPI